MIKIKIGDRVKLTKNEDDFDLISLPTTFMEKIVTVIKIHTGGVNSKEYEFKDSASHWYFIYRLVDKVFPKKITNWRQRIK